MIALRYDHHPDFREVFAAHPAIAGRLSREAINWLKIEGMRNNIVSP
jgi:hypothetical protein